MRKPGSRLAIGRQVLHGFYGCCWPSIALQPYAFLRFPALLSLLENYSAKPPTAHSILSYPCRSFAGSLSPLGVETRPIRTIYLWSILRSRYQDTRLSCLFLRRSRRRNLRQQCRALSPGGQVAAALATVGRRFSALLWGLDRSLCCRKILDLCRDLFLQLRGYKPLCDRGLRSLCLQQPHRRQLQRQCVWNLCAALRLSRLGSMDNSSARRAGGAEGVHCACLRDRAELDGCRIIETKSEDC